MFDPLKDEKVPNDPIPRVHAVARDLAYGVTKGFWSPTISVSSSFDGKETWTFKARSHLNTFNSKWKDALPDAILLASFEYLTDIDQKHTRYVLTPKAFALLESSLATVFISYRRNQSALLALLVLARLKAIGINPFFDIQDIGPGDKFSEHIRKQIAESDHLICLIGPETLESEWVRKEIRWGIEANCQIIPLWHDGFTVSDLNEALKLYPDLSELGEANAIEIKNTGVEDYNSAMATLVNYFGVTPT
jgi:hypothetical protein